MRTNNNLKGVIPTITGVLHLSDGTDINFNDDDIVSGSFSVKNGTSDPSEFTIGGAVIEECDFVLFNYSSKFSGISWFDSKVYITLNFPNNVLIPLDPFYVVSHTETGYRIRVESYSAMKLLDEYQIYEHSFTYPTTALSAVTTIATARGLTVSGMRYPNMSISDPGNDTITEREFVSYIAQMMGQYVTVKGTVLTFGWYDVNNTYDAGTVFNHNLLTEDVTITGLKVTTGDGQTVKTVGQTGYMLNISDNPLINDDNIDTVMDQMYSSVNGMTFRPGTVDIASDANIEAGDTLLVHTKNGNARVIATNVTYKPATKMNVTNDSDAYDGDLRITRSQRIQAMMQNEANKAIDKQLANNDSKLSKAIAQAGGGGSGGGGTWDGNDLKVGGANNAFGRLLEYDDSNNMIAEIGNTFKVKANTDANAENRSFVDFIARYGSMTQRAMRLEALNSDPRDNGGSINALELGDEPSPAEHVYGSKGPLRAYNADIVGHGGIKLVSCPDNETWRLRGSAYANEFREPKRTVIDVNDGGTAQVISSSAQVHYRKNTDWRQFISTYIGTDSVSYLSGEAQYSGALCVNSTLMSDENGDLNKISNEVTIGGSGDPIVSVGWVSTKKSNGDVNHTSNYGTMQIHGKPRVDNIYVDRALKIGYGRGLIMYDISSRTYKNVILCDDELVVEDVYSGDDPWP